METKKIFLASAGELSEDRKEFGNFINKVRAHYRNRGYDFFLIEWEYLENDDHTYRKQDEYNEHIKDCDIFVSLFYTRAGEYTQEEFGIALQESKKRNLPMLTFMRALEEGKTAEESLNEFKKKYFDPYFWGSYGNNDKLHLDFVMWLDSHLFDGRSDLKTEDGNVVLGDVIVAKMSQLPFAANNEDFKRLSKTIKEYPDKIEKLRKRTERFPDDQEFRDDLHQAQDDYDEALKEFARYQQTLLDTAKFIADRRHEQTGEKLKRAMDAFEAGDMAGANAILHEIDIESDEFDNNFENDRQQMHKYIEAAQLQAMTVMAKVDEPIGARIVRVAEIYAKADDRANRSSYPEEKYEKLLFDYARFLYDYAYYTKAVQVYLRQIALSEKLYGTDHADTATSYNNIGLVYKTQGDYEHALEYYKKALVIDEKVLGKDHPGTATDYNNIAGVYYSKGDYEQALEYYTKAFDIKNKVLGENHPSTATSYNNIAMVYYKKGDYEQALEYLKKALDIREKVLGENHPDTASSYNNIGGVYYNKGDYEQALEYYTKALVIDEKVLGKYHPRTATDYNNIGLVYKTQGDYEQALEYYTKALDIFKKVLGENHPDTASSYNNIGWVYRELADYEQALEYYEKAYAIFKVKLGEEHPYTKDVKKSIEIVKMLMDENLPDELKSLLRRGLMNRQ